MSAKWAYGAILAFVAFVFGLILGVIYVEAKSGEKKQKLVIAQALEVERKIMPDKLRETIEIGANDKLRHTRLLSKEQEVALIRAANAISKEVLAAKDVCSGGSFSFGNDEFWESETINGKYQNRKVIGYAFKQVVDCEFSAGDFVASSDSSASSSSVADSDKHERVVKNIREIVGGSEFLNLYVSSIEPFISTDFLRQKTQEMRSEILAKAQSVAEDYSRILKRKCLVGALSFNDRGEVYARQNLAMPNAPRVYDSADARLYKSADSSDTMGTTALASPSLSLVAPNNIESANTTNENTQNIPVLKESQISLSANFNITCE